LLLQRLQSPGPLFYAQERAGFQNNNFRIIKFRTMHVNNPDATRQATRQDDRVFPAGKWLRKYSMDELPQFWNVLSGQMSVVGPRPHLHEHNERFSRVLQSYHIRTLVKPGITGLAQVRGLRGEAQDEAALVERIEADIYYLENWSFTGDLLIMLRTAWQLCHPPKTAY
jgi:lipopolysaccharide/colanic/teichoic acid biosynthesis glycosyltransferase